MSYKLMRSCVNDDREDVVVAITDTQDEAEWMWIRYNTVPTKEKNFCYYIVEEE